jgi:hypothetical protein
MEVYVEYDRDSCIIRLNIMLRYSSEEGVINLARATLATPLYVSVAWTMMVTYQMFTQTAVATVLALLNALVPTMGEWLFLRIDIIVFIYAFAWVFVLSSVIPSMLLGKERSVLVQFFVCLTLTLIAFVVQDLISTYWSGQTQVVQNVAILLSNPIAAIVYLSVPYILMLSLDIRARRKHNKDKRLDEVAAIYMEQAEAAEQEAPTTDQYA